MHIGGSSLYECMECRSRLIKGGKCLTCDSVQIQIQKEDQEEPCKHVVYKVLSFENDTLICKDCGYIKYLEVSK